MLAVTLWTKESNTSRMITFELAEVAIFRDLFAASPLFIVCDRRRYRHGDPPGRTQPNDAPVLRGVLRGGGVSGSMVRPLAPRRGSLDHLTRVLACETAHQVLFTIA
jgi:hypothetical protein